MDGGRVSARQQGTGLVALGMAAWRHRSSSSPQMRANRQHGDQPADHPQWVRLRGICGYLAVCHVPSQREERLGILNLILRVFGSMSCPEVADYGFFLTARQPAPIWRIGELADGRIGPFAWLPLCFGGRRSPLACSCPHPVQLAHFRAGGGG